MSVGLFIGTLTNGIPKIAEYLQLIESAKAKLNRLSDMHLNAANYSLKSALRTHDNKEYEEYLLRAKDKFVDAIAVEDKYANKFSAHFGLAFCNYLLKDKENMEYNIKQAYENYKALWYSIPDKDSLMDMYIDGMNGIDSKEMERFARGLVALCSFGLIPAISKAIQIGKIPIKNHYINQIKAVMPLAEEIERTGYVKPIEYKLEEL